jgi:hypothetical protein
MTMEETGADFNRKESVLGLWAGILTAPFAWFAQLEGNYIIATHLCPDNAQLPLHLVTAGALVITLSGAAIAWSNWRYAGTSWPDDSGGPTARGRFMAALGLMLSGIFFLVIMAQGIPNFLLDPCQQ